MFTAIYMSSVHLIRKGDRHPARRRDSIRHVEIEKERVANLSHYVGYAIIFGR